jgi:hypothetical protein
MITGTDPAQQVQPPLPNAAAPVQGCPLGQEKTRKPVLITLGYRVFGDKSWT